MSSKKDFDLSIELLEKFFSTPHVRKMLNHIYTIQKWRFEHWLQIELSLFFSKHKDNEIAEYYLEETFNTDKRKNKNSASARPDIIFRKKHTMKDLYIFWELKTAKRSSRCISGMLKDMIKIESIKNNVKSYWLVGIHVYEAPQKVKETIIQKSIDLNKQLRKSEIYSKLIKGTEHSLTVF